VDYVAWTNDITYHSDTISNAILSLRRKIKLQNARLSGDIILSLEYCSKNFGWCRQGMLEAASELGISPYGEYTVDEIKEKITPDFAQKYERELKQIGVYFKTN